MKRIYLIIFVALASQITSQVDLVSNLKVCMPFSGNANDLSGNSNNGTVTGAVPAPDRFSNPNSAYNFSGTGKYISISSFVNIIPDDEITISMWAKCDQNTSNCLFQLNPDNYGDRCTGCAHYSNAGTSMMLFDYGDLFATGRTTATGIPIDLVNWHHYVYIVSLSGNKKQMYRDGAIVSNAAYAMTCSNKSKPFQIGGGFDQGSGSLWFQGSIDDICIYNRALSAAEVSALYNITSLCSSLDIHEKTGFSKGVFYPTVTNNGIYNYSGSSDPVENVQVLGVDGKLLLNLSKSEFYGSGEKLNIAHLESGFYFIRMTTAKGTTSQRIALTK